LFRKKREVQNQKLKKLLEKKSPKNKAAVKSVDNLVVNLSEEIFTDAEIELLNRGLNFSVQPQGAPLVDIVADIESAIQFKPIEIKKQIRDDAKGIIQHHNPNRRCKKHKNKWQNALALLKNRDVY